ncbi:hypothetical protein EYF80_022467 [Liparis tanakae]|uniref:Uncharacterized protein n=1 Tax=Liparis tanakae TaxID=230148 RepID=A0A4Z2HP50_9TELE|nr:hypothetical protein EYF80_022467 [Liparis tanakae]
MVSRVGGAKAAARLKKIELVTRWRAGMREHKGEEMKEYRRSKHVELPDHAYCTFKLLSGGGGGKKSVSRGVTNPGCEANATTRLILPPG